MKRVAALWLPEWSIDRILRAEPMLAPPERAALRSAAAPDLSGLVAAARGEQVLQCDAPRNSGWRPGARWARREEAGVPDRRGDAGSPDHRRDAGSPDRRREEVARQIAGLPHHQRPPMRMLGRSSEAADHPFRAIAADADADADARAPGPARRPAVPNVRYPGDGPHPDKLARRGSNDPHSAPPGVAAFFDTGRTMAGLVGQACHAEPGSAAPAAGDGIVLVTLHKAGAQVVVAAASRAARAQGIAPGMALTQVRASCPQVIVRDADPAGDAADLHRLAVLLARRWTPVVAPSDADGLLLDLSGVAHLHGGEARMLARLLRLLARAGVTARAGVADTAGAAWALARFAADPVRLCPPGAQAAVLAPLPAAALRLPEPTLALFRRLGVATVGDVLALPRAPFARRFGTPAARRLDQALGVVAEPLDPVVPPEAVQVAQRFAEPIATAEAIDHWLARLVPRLTQALAQAGLGARLLLFVAERIDGRPQSIRVGFARPNRDPAHILRLIRRRIEEVDPGFGIDALHLRVRRSAPLAAQPFDRTLETAAPDLAGLIDLLANRAVPTWRARPLESDVPERSVGRRAALDPPARDPTRPRRDDVRQLDARGADHPWHPSRPRPARLLRRPEPLDHVMAELPDQPPRRFTWRGATHVVVRADGPERIAGEWWCRSGERAAVRDYFTVEDDTGARFWIFRRGDGERPVTGDHSWHLHGRFG